MRPLQFCNMAHLTRNSFYLRSKMVAKRQCQLDSMVTFGVAIWPTDFDNVYCIENEYEFDSGRFMWNLALNWHQI